MNIVNMEARDLSDAWFQAVYKALDEGRVFKIDRGSYAGQKRLEFDHFTMRIKYPGTRPLLPQLGERYGIPNPVEEAHLYGGEGYDRSYVEYLMTDRKEKGESYTYGERLTNYPLPQSFKKFKLMDDILISEYEELVKLNIIKRESTGKNLQGTYEQTDFINQIELLIWTYKNKGFRNNQMVLQVAHPTDMLLQDPPCLRQIDTRIQDGKLHFFVYFRSWDLWGGFPENLAGIQELKEYIAGEIGVQDGEIIASSKGLHLYDYCFDLGKIIRMREDMKLQGE